MVQILQIISIILLAFIGGQIADPIGKICVDRTEVYKKMVKMINFNKMIMQYLNFSRKFLTQLVKRK